jgi:hypothetical protein
MMTAFPFAPGDIACRLPATGIHAIPAIRRYDVFKYVPYGPVHEVLPYLIRRAEENSNMLGGAGKEIQLIKGELRRRRTGGR